MRHSRPSSDDETTIRPRSTTYDAPPYSWTRLPTLNGNGVSSCVAPSGVWRMRVRRPACAERDSSQYTSSPSSHGSLSAIADPATSSMSIGERQLP